MVETRPTQRKLAAILAADVAGYSRLTGADEEGTLARLKSAWNLAASDADLNVREPARSETFRGEAAPVLSRKRLHAPGVAPSDGVTGPGNPAQARRTAVASGPLWPSAMSTT